MNRNLRQSSRGATLGLVAACCLVIAIIGVIIFVLTELINGSRELSNSTDAGALNIAKNAIKSPSKSAMDFANPDVSSNFAMLAEMPGYKLNLITYNRLVADAVLVSYNARVENTPEAARNARRVWVALNDVGQYLRENLKDAEQAKQFFDPLQKSNRIKMLTGKEATLKDYGVSYMKRGGASNVSFSNDIKQLFGPAWSVPESTSAGSGPKYMAGYKPFTVKLDATGDELTFCAIPVFPGDRPHLVSGSDFDGARDDQFAVGLGSPPSTDRGVIPNAYKSVGVTNAGRDLMTQSVACAIVGATNLKYDMQIKHGIITIKNGPPVAPPAKLPANEKDDIFAHELGAGIYLTGNQPSSVFTTNMNLIDAWYRQNTGMTLWYGPPDVQLSLQDIHRVDGKPVTVADLQAIKTRWKSCDCTSFGEPASPLCMSLLDTWKNVYGRPGSVDPTHVNGSMFDAVEAYKTDVLASRYDARDCKTVTPTTHPSGLKWWQHREVPPSAITWCAPTYADYNFCSIKTPYDYLMMVYPEAAVRNKQMNEFPYWSLPDKWTCPNENPFKEVAARCRQIQPSTTDDEVRALLNSKTLGLGETLYIFANNTGRLVMQNSPPSWFPPGTVADGITQTCEDVYPAPVNSNSGSRGGLEGDGNFVVPYLAAPPSFAHDLALWTPSSGYNSLLGTLEFSQKVTGGGKFCAPN